MNLPLGLTQSNVLFFRGKDPKWMMCGTAACKECANDPCCKKTTNSGLDRDGDTEDLRSCPPGFTDRGWKTYDLNWPAEDVYLRICGNKYASADNCDHTIDVDGWERQVTNKRKQMASNLRLRKWMTSALRMRAAQRELNQIQSDKP